MALSNRLLLRGGLIAGPLFLGSVFVQGLARADYSPIRHPVSSLSLGPRGWLQSASFAVTGGLSLGFVVGLSRTLCTEIGTRVGPVLLAAAAVGILGAAAFPTDPVGGYPPGTPLVPTRSTTRGVLHDVLTLPAFLCVPAAELTFAHAFARHGERGWAAYSAASALGMLVSYALASAGFRQRPGLVEIAGGLQRAAVAIGFIWLTVLAARALASVDLGSGRSGWRAASAGFPNDQFCREQLEGSGGSDVQDSGDRRLGHRLDRLPSDG